MLRNVKIASAIAALGLVGAGVAVAAGSSGGMFARGPSGMGIGMGHAGSGMSAGGMGAAMRGGPMTGMGRMVASELDYLTQMIPHHEEAIAAAKVLRQGTERQEMRDFAASIVATQTAEVVQMKAWLATWYPGRDTDVAYEPMMRDLRGLSGDALDRAFLRDMIPHHMMAVMMSQHLVRGDLAAHDAVVPFAENIRDAQHAEIRTMASWLSGWFGDSPMRAMGRSGMHR